MESQDLPAGRAPAPTPASHRKHKPSSSLGSLYEVLADLDETQLHYLIQEMNHTGHQNVPVSQAVSAFEGPNTSSELKHLRRASMIQPFAVQIPSDDAPPLPNMPPSGQSSAPAVQPAPGVQRQLSKSQQGKLRLQTAFQRAPSLRQGQRQVKPDVVAPEAVIPKAPELRPTNGHPRPPANGHDTEAPKRAFTHLGIINPESHEPTRQRAREGSVSSINLQPPGRARGKSIAYKRIPRPDFNLPAGVTVSDLLQLLEVEFHSQQQHASSSASSSPASAYSAHFTPTTRLAPPPMPAVRPGMLSQTPSWPGARPLRKFSSRLDMALEAERNASGAEEIGLGMLEPRPVRSASAGNRRGSAASFQTVRTLSMESFGSGLLGDAPPTPPVMEGIFDVLENK
ncbi:hypothetical protein CPLU01_10668 [Colletotrichum plurivorum]|uniref:Uncharacterized protein n=1 Tax=Colletotrichum plurivorum TaxID=2175906 RepID=A0A8H6K4P3_9PEZI|nr:hypothetical protein CPLU01_10668 [Colletotrichum plurivorum]